MKKPIANVLDEGLNGLQQGKMVETCIALSGDAGEDIGPLLYTAEYLTQAIKAEPSEEFRRSARGRLMARLQQTQPLPAPRHGDGFHVFDTLSRAFSHLSLVGPTMVKSLATIAVMVAVIAVTLGVATFRSPAPAATSSLATECTLTILSGTVNINTPDAAAAYPGVNGMTLDAGTTVSTSEDGNALLTFFEGSELQLEPSTTVEITEVSEAANHAIAITLTQMAGNTWSHVTKMIDRYSKYEIHTPSAVALVRGTRFLTSVDVNGQTKVETAEGLVSVKGDGEEVYVPVGKKTIVKRGFTPTVPVSLSVPDNEAPETPRTAELLGTQPIQGALLGLELPDNSGNNGQGNANGQSVDKTNNGQGNANGQSADKTNNGQANANGQSVDQTNNGQGNANGQNADKTNNGQGNNSSSVNGTNQGNGGANAPDAALTGDESKNQGQGNNNKKDK